MNKQANNKQTTNSKHMNKQTNKHKTYNIKRETYKETNNIKHIKHIPNNQQKQDETYNKHMKA